MRQLIKNSAKLATLITPLLLTGCQNVSQDPYAGMSAEEIYSRGQEHVRKQLYEDAVSDFEALEAHHPYGEYAYKSQLAVIYSYYRNQEQMDAIAAADRFLRMHPRHKHADYVIYMRALSNFDRNAGLIARTFNLDKSLRDPKEAREAFNGFKQLIEQYPKSKYAADSRQRMVYLKEQLAHHELVIAQYYLKRHAYIAVANRAGTIITHYDGTSYTKDALFLLRQSYHRMKMYDMEGIVQNIIDLNYTDIA